MPRRSRAREVVLQVLFQQDLNPDSDWTGAEEFVRSRLHNHEDLVEMALGLLRGVMRNRDELDQSLAERADNWSLDRMAATDRNVLRLGCYEIVYTDTPPRVAINEAVELARRYGSGQSSQFVNGILDGFLPSDEPSDAGNPTATDDGLDADE
jgi:N utilization substance protein B